MSASDNRPRAGESADGRIAFAEYLEQIALSEVERAADRLQSGAYAVAHPDAPHVRREPSPDDLRDDLEEYRLALAFLELAQDLRREE